MHFKILGPLAVTENGRELSLGGLKQRATLGVLLLNANRVVPASHLLKALWPGGQPMTARKMLQNAVSGLRGILSADGGAELLTQAPGYLLRVDPEDVDLFCFRAHVERARAEDNVGSAAAAAELFREALSLWRGPALSDLAEAGVACTELTAVEKERLSVWEDCFAAELRCGRHQTVVAELETLVEAQPSRERLCGQLMLSLYRCGRQAEALQVYRRTRNALVDELGLEPGRELRDLEGAILSQDPSLELAKPAKKLASVTRLAAAPPAEPPVREPEAVESKQISGLMVRIEAAPPQPGDHTPSAERLRDAASAFQAEVRRCGGTVVGTAGSVWCALFGVPKVHEDDPVRAVTAGLAVRHRLELLGLSLSAVVCTGEALVRSKPGEAGTVPTVAGSVLGQCSVLLGAAPRGDLLACPVTRARSASAVVYHEGGGPDGWRVDSQAGSCAREHPGIPFVDREDELAMLSELLSHPHRGSRSHLVTVLGEAGMGKTRLIVELGAAVEDFPRDAALLVGRTPAYGQDAALAAFAEAVSAYCGIRHDDPVDVLDDKLTGVVHGLVGADETAEWMLSHLRPLVGVPDRTRERPGSSRDVFTALRRFLEEIAARRPLILIIDDVHWADDTTLDFVEGLADGSGPPLFVLAVARPELLERRPGWGGGKRHSVTITLDPLPEDSTAQLLRSLIEHHGLSFPGHDEYDPEHPSTCWRSLLSSVGGNPLFAVEYVRMLRDFVEGVEDGEGIPRQGSGIDTSSPPFSLPYPLRQPVPSSVRSMVATRLDAFPADVKLVLQDAALLSETVWVGAVAAVGGREWPEVARCLEYLERREVLRRVRRSSVSGEAEYVFRHKLVRDVVYSQIPRSERAEKHRRAVRWLETLPTDHSGLLAHHYVQPLAGSGEPVEGTDRRASRVLAEAGRKAFVLGASRAAVRCYETALKQSVPGDPVRAELLLRYGQSLFNQEGHGEEVLVRAREALQEAGNRVLAAEAELEIGRVKRLRGDGAAATAHLDRALTLIRTAPDSYALTSVQCMAVRALVQSGRFAEAEPLARHALTTAEYFGLHECCAVVLPPLGQARIALGDPGGLADLNRAVDLCVEHGLPPTSQLLARGRALAQLGNLAERADSHGEARRLATDYGDEPRAKLLEDELILEHYWAGRWPDALTLIGQLIARTGVARSVDQAQLWWLIRGRIRLARGDAPGAWADANQAVRYGRASVRPNTPAPLALQARIAAELGRTDRAVTAVEELLGHLSGESLRPELGMDLPVAMQAAGIGAEALAGVPGSPWLTAAELVLDGDPLGAADVYAGIGSIPDEAQARLSAAQQLRTCGDTAASVMQLRTARKLGLSMGVSGWMSRHAG